MEDLLSRVNYQIRVVENGKTVDSTNLQRKGRVLQMVSTTKLNKGQQIALEVKYRPGVTNSGCFDTKESLKQCLKDWTAKDQLAYVYTGKW